MIRYSVAASIAVMLIVLLVPFCQAGQISHNAGPDAPNVCDACNFSCTIKICSVADSVYPGQDTVEVPIEILMDTSTTLDHIWVKLLLQAGIKCIGISDNDIGVSPNPPIAASTRYPDIQFSGCSVTGTGNYQHLFNLLVCVDDTVAFSNHKMVSYNDNWAVVKKVGGVDCDANKQSPGYVRIKSGRVWFKAVDDTAYSWQGRDAATDAAKADTITIPITFKASFPVDSLQVGIKVSDSLYYTYSYSFTPNPDYNVSFLGYANNKYLRDYTTHYPADTEVVLGWIKCLAPNYKSANGYNKCAYSTSDRVYFWGNSGYTVRCHSSDEYIPWAEMDTVSGYARFPVYSCTTSIGIDTLRSDMTVIVPVRADHTFTSQNYQYVVSFDTLKLRYDSVSIPEGSDVPTVYANTTAFPRNKVVVGTEDVQTGNFVGLNSNETLFNLHFTAEGSFDYGDSTILTFYTESSAYGNWVHDFYHPSSSKIVRHDDSTSYFILNSGKVNRLPVYKLQVGDYTQYDNCVIKIPIQIADIRFDGEDHARIGFAYSRTIDSVTAGDFSLSGVTTGSGYAMLDLSETVDTTGTLAYIWTTDHVSNRYYFTLLYDQSWMMYNSEADTAWSICSDTIRTNYCPNGGDGRRDANEGLPYVTSLGQNYPNPFNGTTLIQFALAEAGYVQLDVIDILGRKVATIASGSYQPGEHSVIWNGKNSAAENVAAGIYFYSLKTDSFQEAKRMLYLK